MSLVSSIELRPIGIIRTTFETRAACPASGWYCDSVSTVELYPEYRGGLVGLEPSARIFVLWWFHLAHRDVLQLPFGAPPEPLGVFAMRSPERPNPIALSAAQVVSVDEVGLAVRGLECVTGSYVLDVKRAVKMPDGCWM
ncbi:SAM-dependent methyltransferase [Paraburkholderia sp. SARCC-3016]|uniref:SAM-dependent methyltransferase n=1 Tax=Paraburkholderia sp. SARCC-3016 TaxID=3058611 RepID=UPI0028095082|nr:SAM-dependent methyltransferase [Paraburkholderia sp. SARCC-3016]MDQ7982482.1 SAM-dependent methyltransferase [Paraburkholderia sp. SARCC-3016]